MPVSGDQRHGKLAWHPPDLPWNDKRLGKGSLSQRTQGLDGRHTGMEAKRYRFESQGCFKFPGSPMVSHSFQFSLLQTISALQSCSTQLNTVSLLTSEFNLIAIQLQPFIINKRHIYPLMDESSSNIPDTIAPILQKDKLRPR